MKSKKLLKRINLILQDPAKNSNKFYDMVQISNTSFVASYGRIGRTPQEHEYSMGKWDEIYHSKVRKGYIDVSSCDIRVGSAIKTGDHRLALVIAILDFKDNKPFRLHMVRENGEHEYVLSGNISIGYLNPELITHCGFYPNLVKKYKELACGN